MKDVTLYRPHYLRDASQPPKRRTIKDSVAIALPRRSRVRSATIMSSFVSDSFCRHARAEGTARLRMGWDLQLVVLRELNHAMRNEVPHRELGY